MEKLFCKEEPKVELEQEFSSFIVFKESNLNLNRKDENSDCTKIKNEIDSSDYSENVYNYLEKNDFIKQELTHEICIKTETSREVSDMNVEKRFKQRINKKWLKRMFERFKQRLSTCFGKTRGSTTQRVPLSRNICVYCLYCMQPFLNVPQYWDHSITCHLVIKCSMPKNHLKLASTSFWVDTNSNGSEYLFKREVESECGVNTESSDSQFVKKSYTSPKCNYCLKTFKTRGYLKEHMYTHMGIRRFKCEVCLKEYMHKSTFNAHMNVHKLKYFKCEICVKQFTQKRYLNDHMRLHTEVKSFECEICLKQFRRKSGLNTHMNLHTVTESFDCELCPKKFTQKRYLNKHVSLHTDKKSFKCYICSKIFMQKDYLNKHMGLHTGMKSFKCEICSKVFAQKRYLNKHASVHMGGKL